MEVTRRQGQGAEGTISLKSDGGNLYSTVIAFLQLWVAQPSTAQGLLAVFRGSFFQYGVILLVVFGGGGLFTLKIWF